MMWVGPTFTCKQSHLSQPPNETPTSTSSSPWHTLCQQACQAHCSHSSLSVRHNGVRPSGVVCAKGGCCSSIDAGDASKQGAGRTE